MVWWTRALTWTGLATAWIAPNPLSILLLAGGRSFRWILMHHISHKGYDRVPGIPRKYTSKVFGRGWRRFIDWPDWMIPEAWIYEHNVLHHSYTGELDDPDLVERNFEIVRNSRMPRWLRYGIVAFGAACWRPVYYAPNTMRLWMNRHNKDVQGLGLSPRWAWAVLTSCYMFFVGIHFILIPALFLPLGLWAAFSVAVNSILADVVTNVHTFCMIVPNHAGDDVYRYANRPANREEHYVRQIAGSVNMPTGGDVGDFFHLWLNYQIEHHLWPDLPMLKYRQIQPRVRALCEKYEIPYIQESVLTRVAQTARIAVGDADMLQWKDSPRGEPRPAAGI